MTYYRVKNSQNDSLTRPWLALRVSLAGNKTAEIKDFPRGLNHVKIRTSGICRLPRMIPLPPFLFPFCILSVSDCIQRVCRNRLIIALPAVISFCTADRSLWHTGICVEYKLMLFGWLLSGRFMRVFFSTNLKAVWIAPGRFSVLHSRFFFMVYKDLCWIKSIAFWGCSLMGLASVILFCTVNRSSVWQVVCDFSVDSKTGGMMPVLRFIHNLYKM